MNVFKLMGAGFAADNKDSMKRSVLGVPAHKQLDPSKAPGQIITPIPGAIPWPPAVNPLPPAKQYKPAHGGYSA